MNKKEIITLKTGTIVRCKTHRKVKGKAVNILDDVDGICRCHINNFEVLS